VLALITSVFSLVMAGPRVYARMAEDGVFPQFFRFGGGSAPTAAIAAQALLAVGVIALSDLRGLLSYLGFTLSLSGALTVASLFVIVRRHGRQAVSVWGYPVTPLLYVVATLVLAGIAGRRQPMELLTAVITIVSGSVVYYGFGLNKGLRAPGARLQAEHVPSSGLQAPGSGRNS